MRRHLFGKFGVDLTSADGLSIPTALTFVSEAGTDVTKFATPEHFAS